ncbi:S66 peptidase family protein [Cryptosporangium phraense]|uniref:LD-carboxypeptidase n=1 Tax=Cryptosporangium phraense TaxID=2593070 RepID=A0A545APB6_9ACTN|nr:S66 peptidase family protein [Cryptosporangium phraense]TQS43168.1 LD-carboxypeptidase [Cryptosporangium phraense]
MTTLPPRLTEGSRIRVIAPSSSLGLLSDASRAGAVERLQREFGFEISFGAHVEETGPLGTGPVAGRVADLHEAFADPEVDGILTVIGGYHSNQLLPHLDYDLIRANPKVLSGFSDITALQCALLARSNLVTYSGPHFSTFAMRDHNEATIEAFRSAVFTGAAVSWRPSATWTDDEWWRPDIERAAPARNEGWWLLQPGIANGPLIGGNLSTLALLQGTPYWPDLDGAVLVVEDDFESSVHDFARRLTSLLQTGVAVRGLVIGRFQRATGMTQELLREIVTTAPQLAGVPVLANVDVGHTSPIYAFPVGGSCYLAAEPGAVEIVLTRH